MLQSIDFSCSQQNCMHLFDWRKVRWHLKLLSVYICLLGKEYLHTCSLYGLMHHAKVPWKESLYFVVWCQSWRSFCESCTKNFILWLLCSTTIWCFLRLSNSFKFPVFDNDRALCDILIIQTRCDIVCNLNLLLWSND